MAILREKGGGGGGPTIPESWQPFTRSTKARTVARRPRRRFGLEPSSTTPVIRGLGFDGSTIRGAYKLSGGRRLLHLANGARVKTDRATLHELAKLAGTLDYRRRLLDAPTLSAKKAIIHASRSRQRAIMARAIARERAGMAVAPKSVAEVIARRIETLERLQIGSPILGETPATSAVAPHHGPAKTFSVIARTGVQFRTIRRGGRVRVVPMNS